MKPLLSRFEIERPADCDATELSPPEELTTLDQIYKSTLLSPNNILQASTKVTKVRAETIDDD